MNRSYLLLYLLVVCFSPVFCSRVSFSREEPLVQILDEKLKEFGFHEDVLTVLKEQNRKFADIINYSMKELAIKYAKEEEKLEVIASAKKKIEKIYDDIDLDEVDELLQLVSIFNSFASLYLGSNEIRKSWANDLSNGKESYGLFHHHIIQLWKNVSRVEESQRDNVEKIVEKVLDYYSEKASGGQQVEEFKEIVLAAKPFLFKCNIIMQGFENYEDNAGVESDIEEIEATSSFELNHAIQNLYQQGDALKQQLRGIMVQFINGELFVGEVHDKVALIKPDMNLKNNYLTSNLIHCLNVIIKPISWLLCLSNQIRGFDNTRIVDFFDKNFEKMKPKDLQDLVVEIMDETKIVEESDSLKSCLNELFEYFPNLGKYERFHVALKDYCCKFNIELEKKKVKDQIAPKKVDKVKLIKTIIDDFSWAIENIGSQFNDASYYNLPLLREAASKEDWQTICDVHFDWWMFPNPAISRSHGSLFNVDENIVTELLSDYEYYEKYKEGFRIVCKSFGWDIEAFKFVSENDKVFRGPLVRLKKMLSSLDFYVNTLWQNIYILSNPLIVTNNQKMYKELFLYLESLQKATEIWMNKKRFSYSVAYYSMDNFIHSSFVNEKIRELESSEPPVNTSLSLDEFLNQEVSSTVQQFNLRVPSRNPENLRYVSFNVGKFSIHNEALFKDKSIPVEERVRRSKGWKKFIKFVLPSIDADVWGFNEWPGYSSYLNRNQLTPCMVAEMKNLGYDLASYCHGNSYFLSGNAIFIRSGMKFESIESKILEHDPKSIRCVAQIKLTMNNEEVFIMNTHLDNRSPYLRKQQMSDVLDMITPDRKRVILAGDFNQSHIDGIFKGEKGLRQIMLSHKSLNGKHVLYTHYWRAGYLTDWIDYILFLNLSRSFYGIYHTNVSDHLPVIADFSFDPNLAEYAENLPDKMEKRIKNRIVAAAQKYIHYRPVRDVGAFRNQ